MARLDGAAPNWTVKDITPLTEVSGLDGESRPDWFVPADQLPAPSPAPTAAPERRRRAARRPRRRDRRATSSGSRRGRRRSAASCASGSTPTRHALPAGLLARTSPGSSGSPCSIIEAAGPYAAAIKPNLAFYEALGSAGMAALERIRGRIPADIPVVIDAKRGDIGSTAARHARRAVRPARRRRRDRQPVPGRRGHRAAVRARRSLRLRPVPDLEPRRGRVPGPRRRRRSRRSTRPPSRSTCASRAASRRGARAARSASSSGRPRPPSCTRSGPSRPGSASWCPGIGAQGGEIEPVLRDGPATAAPAGGGAGPRPAGQRVARDQPAPPWRAGRRRSSGRPR